MSTSKVKAAQLWGKNKEDLTKQLGELKTELGQLRIQKITSSGSKLNKMYAPPSFSSFALSLSRDDTPPPHGGRPYRTRELIADHGSESSGDIRKSIARVLTVINAKQRHQLRLFYKNKKYAPLDLRAKQTRAIRRRLSKADAERVTEKQRKKTQHFPQRKYAVKSA
ncbi:hypothetical protein VD0002_g7046 [Verticillium dahliae]|uniref:60S ribosomal protein L35 n=1 Tax=Verticillium dahliae TaxID=27337 RepID=A0AA45AMT9_VERDA|nr:hypothetical protein BJF96_g4835 [Verticillium dahliae]PNH47717.1 hypothetical protein VD0004_g576 [Verticillium dahliae]PNH60608.1 hypothetical protein VD0002_g7046 [Verticillium dahliae]